MDSILITGITGQLGTALTKRLKDGGLSVSCFVRRPSHEYPLDLSRFKVFTVDISDRQAIFRHSNELKGKIGTIVHLASRGDGFSRQELFNTVLKGTINLYDFANEIRCPKFLYFSSILAAGWAPQGIPSIDESFIPSPSRLCYFGKMKLEAENNLLNLSEKGFSKTVILRPGNIYGCPKLSFVKFVADLLKKRKKIFYQRAKKSVMWAPIHTQDVIDCILLLIKKENFNNQVYFLTGTETPTLTDLAEIIADRIGVSLDSINRLNGTEKVHLLLRVALDSVRSALGRPSFPNFIYSNSKIKNELGFVPKVKLMEGVRETADWAIKEELI